LETSKVGKRGAVVIPAPLRRRFGIEEGTLVVAEATEEGVLIRPAVVVPVEVYSPERKARLLLENATDAEDYARVAGVVRGELVTSAYAVEEARRNLGTAERRADLNELLEAVRVSNVLADPAEHPEIESSGLPEKDLPILRAAVAANATHLVTGDRKHFGHLFGEKVAGVLVARPADHLAERGR
jgi:AbrB family looped-hinge helix DNA binding protein